MIPNNIGAYITGFNALDPQVVTAGAGVDGTTVDGNVLDRLATGKTLYQSAKLIVTYKAVLAAAATLSIGLGFKDGATNNPQTAYGSSLASAVVATGPGGGGTVRGTVELSVDLRMAREYLRATVAIDLSAANTDTCAISAVLVEGGSDEKPAT